VAALRSTMMTASTHARRWEDERSVSRSTRGLGEGSATCPFRARPKELLER
jgi:hypothetical protein